MATAEQTTIPYSDRIEEDLLGACFLHPQAFAEASRFCGRDDFYLGNSRRVWSACEAMTEKHGRVSLAVLDVELMAQGMEEAEAHHLAGEAGAWASGCEDHTLVRMWAQELEALAIRRRLIGVAGKIATAGYDERDADDAVRVAYQALGDATVRKFTTGETTIEDTAGALYDRLVAGETGRGLATGLPRVDAAQRGLRPGELTVLAARTAHGKTALALQVARHVAGTGASVAILSLEMDADALTERLVSAEAGVSVRDVLEGRGDDEGLRAVIQAIGPISELPITFAVAPATTLPEVKRVVSRWADVGLANLLVVDYLQLVGLGGRGQGNRAYEVGAVAQGLRDLAQELKIPVLALAQLNRAVEHRGDPTPMLADLRESGGVEQAADAVWLLHRPELFTRSENDKGVAFLHLAKNRAGPLAHEPLNFDAATTKFRLLEEHHRPDA